MALATLISKAHKEHELFYDKGDAYAFTVEWQPPAVTEWQPQLGSRYAAIPPGTPGVDLRDILYSLQRAKNRLNNAGWSKGAAVNYDGRICLGTALGMIAVQHYYDGSKGARAAVGRVERALGRSIPHWNDRIPDNINQVQHVLDRVINATIEELAHSV